LVPPSLLNVVRISAHANSGQSSLSANHTTFVVGSGAYSAKLLAGTRQRFSGFSQPRQCGDADVGDRRPARAQWWRHAPQRIVTISVHIS
jgi:hypothetical protein